MCGREGSSGHVGGTSGTVSGYNGWLMQSSKGHCIHNNERSPAKGETLVAANNILR